MNGETCALKKEWRDPEKAGLNEKVVADVVGEEKPRRKSVYVGKRGVVYD